MKKVMILSAVALAFCLAMPQVSHATNVQNDVAVIQNKDVKYTEITVDQVPEAVSKAVAKDYAGFKTDNVFKGDDGTYKLAVSKSENKMVLFYSEDGKLVKSEKANAMKPEKPSNEPPVK
jgi:hypothetical protein